MYNMLFALRQNLDTTLYCSTRDAPAAHLGMGIFIIICYIDYMPPDVCFTRKRSPGRLWGILNIKKILPKK